jgi:hypothetical protein
VLKYLRTVLGRMLWVETHTSSVQLVEKAYQTADG